MKTEKSFPLICVSKAEESPFEEDQDFYTILGISENAHLEDIRGAFQAKQKQMLLMRTMTIMPLLSEQEILDLNQRITQAYTTLSHPEQRRKYDLEKQSSFTHNEATSFLNTHNTSHSSYWMQENVQAGASSVKEPTTPATPTYQPSAGASAAQIIHESRLYKKMPIDRLSDLTKIPQKHLRAIETGAFANLPAAVYVRGFIIQLTRLLDLPSDIVQRFMSDFTKAQRSSTKQSSFFSS